MRIGVEHVELMMTNELIYCRLYERDDDNLSPFAEAELRMAPPEVLSQDHEALRVAKHSDRAVTEL